MGSALSFALQLIALAPKLVAGVSSAIETMSWGESAVKRMVAERRDPTEEEWSELRSKLATLRERLHSDDK